MATVQASKSNRRGKTSQVREAVSGTASPLSTLYERQRDAVEAARSKGVHEVEVSFRMPGAEFVAIVQVADLKRFSAGKARKKEKVAETAALEPTDKLRKAIAEAHDVTVFYKTSQELFDALEAQD